MNSGDKYTQADLNQMNKAYSLLEKASLVSPALRFLCETAIKSKSKELILELIPLLETCIREKEEAYRKYKEDLSAILKKNLNIINNTGK